MSKKIAVTNKQLDALGSISFRVASVKNASAERKHFEALVKRGLARRIPYAAATRSTGYEITAAGLSVLSLS